MRFRYMTTQGALDAERLGRDSCPLDPGVIPNYMGINLFLPAAKAPKRTGGGSGGA